MSGDNKQNRTDVIALHRALETCNSVKSLAISPTYCTINWCKDIQSIKCWHREPALSAKILKNPL